MVTDRAENAPDENRSDCESRSSSNKDIPKWNGVAHISCPKLNELLCCQRVAHSVLFYIFVVLFVLVFVYILRKLVSLPVGLSKNGSRKPSNSTVHNHSSDALTKRMPKKWPKIDNFVEHSPVVSLTHTALTSPKDKKSRIYSLAQAEEKRYGLSGFSPNNQNPILEDTTPSHSHDGRQNYLRQGKVGRDGTSISQDKNKENIYKPTFSTPSGENPSTVQIPQLGRANSELPASSYSGNSGLSRTSSDGLSSSKDQYIGLGDTHNEWTAWDHPSSSSGVEKIGYGRSASANLGFSGLEKMYSRLPQTGDSELGNRVTSPAVSGASYENMGTKSSSWPNWGSSWPAGSGFGVYRTGERNQQKPYGTQSSSQNTHFYYDRASGKWTYSANSKDPYNYNHDPNNKMGIDANTGRFSYTKAFSSNSWNPYNNYGEIKQTEDRSNFSALDSISVGQNNVGNFVQPATTKEVNQQHQTYAKVAGEEMHDGIHRWPFEEGRGEEPRDDDSRQLHAALSSSISKRRNSVKHVKRKKSKHLRKPMYGRLKGKRREKAKENQYHYSKNGESMTSQKKTQTKTVKKSMIPRHSVLKSHSRRRQVKHNNVKSKVKTKLRGDKPWLLPKVRRLKIRIHDKRRPTNSAISKNRRKSSTRRFSSYSSYKRFVKRHPISDVLMGTWHHATHHVRHCKTLSQFNTNGKVQLSRQYMHRKRKYRYTVLSCRYNKDNDNNDDSEDADDDSDTVSPPRSQICRELWYITTGKITLKTFKREYNRNTYIVTLCNTRNSSTGHKDRSVKILEDEDHNDNGDSHSSNANEETGNDERDLNSDVSGDHDDTDSDDDNRDADEEIGDGNDDVDFDDKTDTKERTRNNEDDIDLDNDDDNDKDPETTKEKTDTNSKTEDDDTATDTDDLLTDSTSGGDSESDDKETENDDDDDIDLNKSEDIDHDTNTRKNHNTDNQRKKSATKRKAKITKIHERKSKGIIKKSSIRKPRRRHIKSRKRLKTNKKQKYNIASNRDAKDDNSNIYERLREVLTKNNDLNVEDDALAKLVAAISQKKSSSAKRKKHKEARVHSQNTESKIKTKMTTKMKESPLFENRPIKDINAVSTLLHERIYNNVESHSQVTRKRPSPEGNSMATNKETNSTTVNQVSQVDTKDLLKALLSRFLTGSTSMTTTAPTPTAQPTLATTHAPDPVLILNPSRKLGMKASLNGNTNSALEGLLPTKKSRDGLIRDKILDTKRTYAFAPEVPPLKAQQLPLLRNAPKPISLNPSEQPLAQTPRPESSLRSRIPTAESTQDHLSSLKSSQLSPLPTPLTFTAEERNTIAATSPQGTRGRTTTSDSTSGYSAYRSQKKYPYSSQTPSINILCFGDSLTSGYYNHGHGKHPYSIRLSQLLDPRGTHRYNIVTRGMVGEMAHGGMTKRLPTVLNEGTRFDWVLILGGTNDVAHVKNFGDDDEFTRQLINVWSPKIVNDIEKLHETARQYGARTVLMTIPETAYELWPEFRSIRSMRLSVNAALRQYASQVRDTTVLCDLAVKLPRSSLSKELQKFYWNDHIHMNPVGYNKMAEVIQQCIRPYLRK